MLRIFAFLFASACLVLAIFTSIQYQGHWFYYATFTLVVNALLFNGFRRSAIFFDMFIGVFLWLGFWLKFSVRVTFSSGVFHEPVGLFDGSADAFDRALSISSCGIGAILIASLLRERFFTYPLEGPQSKQSAGCDIYKLHRKLILIAFFASVILIALSNSWLGIYQRGVVVQTHLPFGLNGIYKWLLQFGLASFCALIIRFEIEIHQRLSSVAIIAPIFETFFSNTSLLSRGMVLNFTALALGAHKTVQTLKLRMGWTLMVITAVLFCVAFAGSVLAVNYLRASWQISENETYQRQTTPDLSSAIANQPSAASIVPGMTTPLFVDRWVGIEGVMAVSSHEKLGWKLWRDAWQEKFQEGTLSLYDRFFIRSPYESSAIDRSKNHYISLPGVVAFLFYPGSLAFLFAALLSCAALASAIEIATYRFAGGNLILCSLFGQVIAFRLTSIGYVPNQSYLFFGSLLLNLLIIIGLEYYFRKLSSKSN